MSDITLPSGLVVPRELLNRTTRRDNEGRFFIDGMEVGCKDAFCMGQLQFKHRIPAAIRKWLAAHDAMKDAVAKFNAAEFRLEELVGQRAEKPPYFFEGKIIARDSPGKFSVMTPEMIEDV